MAYLLDTNTCIGWLRNSEPKIVSRISQEPATNLYLSSIVVAELIYGAERSRPTYRSSNLSRLALLRRMFVSLPFDDNAAEEYGKVRSHLAAAGTPIGPNDMLIAAIALSKKTTLVTHNTTEFSRVPGLILEDWQ